MIDRLQKYQNHDLRYLFLHGESVTSINLIHVIAQSVVVKQPTSNSNSFLFAYKNRNIVDTFYSK